MSAARPGRVKPSVGSYSPLILSHPQALILLRAPTNDIKDLREAGALFYGCPEVRLPDRHHEMQPQDTPKDTEEQTPQMSLALAVEDPARPSAWQMWLASRLQGQAAVSFVSAKTGSSQSTLSELPWTLLRRYGRSTRASPWSDTSLAVPPAPVEKPDIVLSLCPNEPAEGIDTDTERWWLLAGNWQMGATWPIGHDEVESRAPVTELLLCRRNLHGHTEILARGVYNTRPSASLNETLLLGKVPLLIRQAMKRRGQPLRDRAEAPLPADRPLPERALRRYGVGLAKDQWRIRRSNLLRRLGRRPGMWSLFFGRGDVLSASLETLSEARPAANEYWADPFLWRHGDRLFVFYEAYDYPSAVGRVAVGEWRDGGFHPLGDVLAPPYHLSYPFLLEHEGALLMIPESSAANRVEIWRCTDIPLRFERIATAFEGQRVADLTLFCRNGQWWAFCAMDHDGLGDMNSELYAFAVDGPLMREVVPHRQNPIVSDSRYARPAGRIFERGGRWFRPSQNNSHGIYGYGLNLMEIKELSLDVYREAPARQILPGFRPGLIATHHLDISGDVFVIDGCYEIGGNFRRSLRS